MYYSDQTIDEVRSRNDIVAVIGSYLPLKRSSSDYVALCPFHNEKTGSFHVNPARQTFKCFGCGKGGNVFTFLMEYENVSFPEALQMLAERVGYELPKRSDEKYDTQANKDRRERFYALYKEAAEYYYRKLREDVGRFGLEYFTKRGLTPQTMREFGLGYSDGHLYDAVKGRYEDAFLMESGLFTFRESGGAGDKFFNRVMFPIFDGRGKVMAFGGRVMGDAMPKYLNSPETMIFDKGDNLYNLHIARRSRRKYLILCEGYMDVISLVQAGFDNAVATLGTALTDRQARKISRFTKDVVLTYDSDEAGQKAINRAIPILHDAGVRARIVSMKPYKDPDEFIKNLGADEYEKRIREAQPSFEFELRFIAAQHDPKDAAQKTEFQREAARLLVRFRDTLERNNHIDRFCELYIDDPGEPEKTAENRRAFRKMVNEFGQQTLDREQRKAEQQPQQPEVINGDGEVVRREGLKKPKADPILTTQNYLLTMIASYPKIRAVARKYLKPDDFSGSVYRRVVAECYDLPADQAQDIAALSSRFTTVEEQNLVVTMLTDDMAERAEDRKKAVCEAIVRMTEHRIDEEILQAKSGGRSESGKSRMELVRERDRLRKELPARLAAEAF